MEKRYIAAAAAVLGISVCAVMFHGQKKNGTYETIGVEENTATPSELPASGEDGDDTEETDVSIEDEISDPNEFSNLNPPDTKPGTKTWINDTMHSSESKVDTDLYRYAFHKMDNFTNGTQYVPNREFVEMMDSEIVDREKQLGMNFMKAFFATGYQSIKQDKDGYIKKLQGMKEDMPVMVFTSKSEEPLLYSKDEYLETIVNWYVDNEVQAEVNITTDDSLIWYDQDRTYIRYEVDIKPYHCLAKEMPDEFLAGIDYIHGGQYVVDVGIVYYSPEAYKTTKGVNDLYVRNIQVIGTLEDK